jgi:Raf kinase inhibitor-like YbhB/YbcL family protein
MTIEVRSSAIDADAPIPHRHARDGDDLSPPLAWRGVPTGTASIAVLCEDPDAPTDTPFVHWVHYDIPPDTEELLEGDDTIGTPGRNDYGEVGYGGPQPPRGHGTHHYHFRVYALDRPLELPRGASREEVARAMNGHVLDEGELVGTFQR